MKISIFGREIITRRKRLFGIGKSDDYYSIQNYGNDVKKLNDLKSYRLLVANCIDLIAQQVGNYKPIIYKMKPDGTKDAIDKHPLLDLLRNPGGTDNNAIPIGLPKLLQATQSFIELQGDVYWYLAKGMTSGLPREIVILRADTVGRQLDANGDIARFYTTSSSGVRTYIEIDEMLPFVGFNPEDPYTGLGMIDKNRGYIETDDYTTAFTKNFFKNNGGVNGVLELQGEVTKGAFRKFVRGWRDKHEGVENAGKLAIIRASEAKFTKVGLGLDELNMNDLRGMSRDDILMAFKIPLPLMGKSDQTGLGRNNVEALEYIFAKYTIEQKMLVIDSVLQFALERYYDKTGLLTIGHANIIPEDKEFNQLERDKGVDRWLTRDEIREQGGMPAIDGGDQLFVNFNSVPLSQAGDNAGPVASATGGKGIKLKAKRITTTTSPKKKDQTDVIKEHFRLSLMRNQTRYERRYRAKLKPILVDQRKEALNNLEAHGNSLTKDSGQKLFDDASADTAMNQALTPVLVQLAEQQGALAMVFAGDEENQFRLTQNFESIVTRGTLRMAKDFNDQTLAALNSTLAEGIREGESIGSLKQRVNTVYEDADNYRSERVARTETLKASNSATVEAYRQTGYVTGKQWYVNPDACEQCLEFDGLTVPLDDSFLAVGASYTVTGDDGEETTYTNDYDTIEEPPLHPNCRCTIIPVR